MEGGGDGAGRGGAGVDSEGRGARLLPAGDIGTRKLRGGLGRSAAATSRWGRDSADKNTLAHAGTGDSLRGEGGRHVRGVRNKEEEDTLARIDASMLAEEAAIRNAMMPAKAAPDSGGGDGGGGTENISSGGTGTQLVLGAVAPAAAKIHESWEELQQRPSTCIVPISTIAPALMLAHDPPSAKVQAAMAVQECERGIETKETQGDRGGKVSELLGPMVTGSSAGGGGFHRVRANSRLQAPLTFVDPRSLHAPGVRDTLPRRVLPLHPTFLDVSLDV
jgi:hypothetical protein